MFNINLFLFCPPPPASVFSFSVMSDSQHYPLNLFLSKNYEFIPFILYLKIDHFQFRFFLIVTSGFMQQDRIKLLVRNQLFSR